MKFKEWLVKENVLGYPIAQKWMSLPLPTLKRHLMRMIDMFGSEANRDFPEYIELKETLKDIIPLMRQKHGMAITKELDMLEPLLA